MYSKKYLSPVILLAMLLFSIVAKTQVVKRLYLANDDHTDYMWSGNEADYDSAFVKMLDYQLDAIDATKNNAPNFQSRYNCDGNYWLKTYQKNRSEAKFNRLIAAIKSGHISSPLNSVVSCFGAQPAEAAIRGMYYAGQLERKHNLRFTLASAMENNTVPLGLSAIWAGAGAKYSWKGVGGYGSQLTQESMRHRKYQLYNYAGLDGSSVLMKWYTISGSLGGYAECRLTIKSKTPIDTANDLSKVISKLDSYCDTISPISTYPFNVAGAFGFGHDNLDTYIAEPFVIAAKAGTNTSRTVRVSNEEDFFKDIENTYPKLPSQSVSYGNEWDLLSASMNETTAEVRRATEKLRTAEALASVVSLKSPDFASNLISAKNLAWDAFGLYWEHNWTADGPIGNKVRAAWQVKIKDHICNYVDGLYNLSLKNLSGQLNRATNPRFFVFNPLSWVRDDVTDIPFAEKYAVKIIDITTNKEVASQVITKNNIQFLRIAAIGVPAVGYKIFEIRKEIPTKLPNAATEENGYFSNGFYRVKLNKSGVITELFDLKANGKQLVRSISGKYLNDLGTTDLDDGNALEVENAGPVSVTLKAVSKNPILHTVRVTLFTNSPRVEIENSIDTNFSDNKTWAFSLNMENQTTRHEELGDILIVKKESNGGHYADQNARYDWQTFNHFADMSDANYGVTLSNIDCSFFKLGKSTVDSLWEQSTQLNVLAGGQIDKKKEDGGILGIHNQYGQMSFHYHFAIETHRNAFNAVNAMRFSLEHQNPLTAAMLTGTGFASENASFSLLDVSNPNVVLWSIKPSEEGIKNGLIARFWNVGNQREEATVKLYRPISKAWKTTHIETNEKELNPINGILKTNFNQQQINTYRLGVY